MIDKVYTFLRKAWEDENILYITSMMGLFSANQQIEDYEIVKGKEVIEIIGEEHTYWCIRCSRFHSCFESTEMIQLRDGENLLEIRLG